MGLRELLGCRVQLVFLGQLDKWARLVREVTPALQGSKDPRDQLDHLVSRERLDQLVSPDSLVLLEQLEVLEQLVTLGRLDRLDRLVPRAL